MNAALDVFPRGRADDLLKVAGEIIDVGEACQCGDLGDATVAGLHQGNGISDPRFQNVSMEGLSNAALDSAEADAAAQEDAAIADADAEPEAETASDEAAAETAETAEEATAE